MDEPAKKQGFWRIVGNGVVAVLLTAVVIGALPAVAFVVAMALFAIWAIIGLVANAILASTCAPGSIWCWTTAQAWIGAVLILSAFGWACSLVPSIWKAAFDNTPEKKPEEPKRAD